MTLTYTYMHSTNMIMIVTLLQYSQIPYSGKLSSEKTFVISLFCACHAGQFFSAIVWGSVDSRRYERAIHGSFVCEITFTTNSQKFSLMKDSHYSAMEPPITDPPSYGHPPYNGRMVGTDRYSHINSAFLPSEIRTSL